MTTTTTTALLSEEDDTHARGTATHPPHAPTRRSICAIIVRMKLCVNTGTCV